MNGYVGLPWWAFMIMASFAIRLTIFPLILIQIKKMSKLGPTFPLFAHVKETWAQSNLTTWQKFRVLVQLYR